MKLVVFIVIDLHIFFQYEVMITRAVFPSQPASLVCLFSKSPQVKLTCPKYSHSILTGSPGVRWW